MLAFYALLNLPVNVQKRAVCSVDYLCLRCGTKTAGVSYVRLRVADEAVANLSLTSVRHQTQ